MPAQEVHTGRTVVMFNHAIDVATQQAVQAFVNAQAAPPALDTRIPNKNPVLLRQLGIAVVPGTRGDACTAFPTALYCADEGVVSTPVDEAVTDDDDSDLYDHLKAVRALESAFTGDGVSVALLDTGYYPHPDFYKQVKGRVNFVGDDPDDVEDRNGHATHCAGLIVGPRKGRNAYGLAPAAELYIGRVIDDDGVGLDANLLCGLEWAAYDIGAQVIVVSCAMPGDAKTRDYFDAIARDVRASGGVIIAPAGNKLEKASDKVNYPANCPSVLAAGAVNRRLKDAEFSCVGTANDPVEVTAPGVGIRSGWIDGKYRRASGTSMAAAITGGIAALLKEAKPNADLFRELEWAAKGHVIYAP